MRQLGIAIVVVAPLVKPELATCQLGWNEMDMSGVHPFSGERKTHGDKKQQTNTKHTRHETVGC